MNPSLPRPEAIIVAPAIAAYVGRLQSLDPFGESPGKPSKEGFASPREVLNALHHVLSGGQVRIEIVSDGSASQVEELGGLLVAGIEQTGALDDVFDPGWARL